MTTTTRWEICTIAHESPDLILSWVAHNLSLGVARINLFLDRPIPRVSEVLANHPRIRLVDCDEAFWNAHPNGPPIPKLGPKQKAPLQDLVDTSHADWMFHIDVDEFICGPSDIGTALAALPPQIEHAAIPAAERIYLGPPADDNILDGVFRRATPRPKLAKADAAEGPVARYLDRGMTAYFGGKSAFRPRVGLKVGVHGPKPPKPETGVWLEGFELLHFDGLTPAHWINKRLRMLRDQPNAIKNSLEHRRNQLLEMSRRQDDPDALMAFYLEIKLHEGARAAALGDLNLIFDPAFDPRPAVAAELPGVSVDLGIKAFDSFHIL